MEGQTPAAIRVEVPEEFGEVYDGAEGRQWVKRRFRISGYLIKFMEGFSKKLDSIGDTSDEAKAKEAKANEKECWQALSEVFTDWNLEGDDGPLPKPWKNPKAFAALFESDWILLMWVAGLVAKSIDQLVNPSKN